MHRSIRLVAMAAVVIMIGAGMTPASAGGRPLPSPRVELPSGETRRSIAQARSAFDRLSPAQRKRYLDRFRAEVAPAIKRAYEKRAAAPAAPARPRLADILSGRAARTAKAQGRAEPAITTRAPAPSAAGGQVRALSGDADQDGFDEDFETQLADGFTPVYHVSSGDPNGFATFGDHVPQTVQQQFGSTPPVSYYRVQPLGFGSSEGIELGLVRIDYLTLWNRDDGLALDGGCEYNLVFMFNLIGLSLAAVFHLIGRHDIDNERSAILAAAPTPEPGVFNPDPGAYRVRSLYTAAHEGTFTDQSAYYFFGDPPPYGSHVGLALSKSKHATYTFNPGFLPLLPGWVLEAALVEIDILWQLGHIDDIDREIYRGIAFTAYFQCVVERFNEQGGDFSWLRINVGEPDRPINGSGFIQDDRLYYKLTGRVW